MQIIDFQTEPSRYRHWRIECDGDVAYLIMDVDQAGGLFDGYELKLNSYDLGVDIELNDAVQRLRFEHPEVRCVVIKSGKDNVFCAGANIRMLGKSTHAQKVNFCKFTNETRLAIEDASENSKQAYVCAINGNAAGGGYELALAADHIMLVDDRRSAVALPETPLLAVLPGTGGLTRVTDKRKVRRDRADLFCSIEEGIRGSKAVEWRLVDEVVPNSKWKDTVTARAHEIAARSDRPKDAKGIAFTPLERKIDGDRVAYSHVDVEIDRGRGLATVTVRGPSQAVPASIEAAHALGAKFWPLTVARELEDAILHLRANEQSIGVLLLRTDGNAQGVLDHDEFLGKANGDWLMREIRHYLKRVLKRVDVTPRSIIALIEPGSCFAGHAGRTRLRCRPLVDADRNPRGRQPPASGNHARPSQFRLVSDGQWTHAFAVPLSRRTGAGRPRSRESRASHRRRGGCGARPGHARLRGLRLGRRIARHAGGAHELLARRHDRHGSKFALRRPGDDGDQDLRTADRLAELDFPAAERDRRPGRAQALRQRRVADI